MFRDKLCIFGTKAAKCGNLPCFICLCLVQNWTIHLVHCTMYRSAKMGRDSDFFLDSGVLNAAVPLCLRGAFGGGLLELLEGQQEFPIGFPYTGINNAKRGVVIAFKDWI